MRIHEMGFSMAPHAPLYGPPPYYYSDVSSLYILYRCEDDVLRQVVPEPLKIDEQCRVVCVTSDYPSVTGLGSYRECSFFVVVRHEGELGCYSPFMYVDSDIAMAAGREIYGVPKKMATIRLQVGEGCARATTERAGFKIAVASVLLSGPGQMDLLDLGPIYGLRLIPSLSETEPPERRLALTHLEGVSYELVQGGFSTLQMEPSAADPTFLLKPKEFIAGMYGQGGLFTLPMARSLKLLT